MNKSVLFVLLSCLILWNCGMPEPPESLQARIRQALYDGENDLALQLAQQGGRDYKAETDWSALFQMLEAEALIKLDKIPDAKAILTSPYELPDLEARRIYLEWLAKIYSAAPQLEQDLQALQKAEELAESEQLDAMILAGKAWLQKVYGLRKDAKLSFRRAEASAEAAGDTILRAKVLNNWGTTNLEERQFGKAVSLLQRSLEMNPDPNTTAHIQLNLGLCFTQLAQYERGMQSLEKALELFTDDKLSQQRCHGEMGNNRFYAGDPDGALDSYQQAFQLAKQLADENPEARDNARQWAANLASLHAQLQRWDGVAPLIQNIRDLGDADWTRLIHLEAHLTLGKDQPQQAIDQLLPLADIEDPIRWEIQALLGKAYLELGQFETADRHYQTAMELAEAQSSQQQQVIFQIGHRSLLHVIYLEYVEALMANNRPQKALAVAESGRALLLASRLAVTSEVKTAEPPAKLTQGQAIIAYWLNPDQSYAWVIDAGGTRWFELPGRPQLERRVNRYQEALIQRRHDRAQSLGQELYTDLLAPAEIKQGTRVAIVADGILHRLNFETLPLGNGQFWLQQVTSHRAPSLALARFDGGEKISGSLLLMGDPIPVDTYPRLPGAVPEMNAVETHWQSENVVRLEGAAAAASEFKTHMDKPFAAIHVAAHAEANGESPLDSFVVLSPGEGQLNDRLYARDLVEMDLAQTQLVTLSACRGADGGTYGGEGLVGFTWAFAQAGVPRVVAGLWDVDDEAAPILMEYFYRGLEANKTTDEALRDAKLALIDSGERWRNPYYWGVFQLYMTAP